MAEHAAALSVSLSPFLPSSVEDEDALHQQQQQPQAQRRPAAKRGVRFEAAAEPAFQPTHAVFTPRLADSAALRYRKPDDRVPGLAPPPGAGAGSTLAQPNYDDFLRRVSVVLYQHLRRCEKRHREQRRSAAAGGIDGAVQEERAPEEEEEEEGAVEQAQRTIESSLHAADADGELAIHEVFREEHFVTPQYQYTFLRVPRVHPLTAFALRKVSAKRHVPSVDEIFRFCKHLFNQAQLSAECSIVCLIYIERLMEQAGVPLLVATWKPIVLCGLLLASKVGLATMICGDHCSNGAT